MPAFISSSFFKMQLPLQVQRNICEPRTPPCRSNSREHFLKPGWLNNLFSLPPYRRNTTSGSFTTSSQKMFRRAGDSDSKARKSRTPACPRKWTGGGHWVLPIAIPDSDYKPVRVLPAAAGRWAGERNDRRPFSRLGNTLSDHLQLFSPGVGQQFRSKCCFPISNSSPGVSFGLVLNGT